jgi:hypothetical protein
MGSIIITIVISIACGVASNAIYDLIKRRKALSKCNIVKQEAASGRLLPF